MFWRLLFRPTAHQAIWGGTPPTPPAGNILYWGVDDLQWGAANQITWG